MDSDFNKELLISFGELKSGIRDLSSKVEDQKIGIKDIALKLEDQDKRLRNTEEILYKLAINEEATNRLTQDFKEIKKKVATLENSLEEVKTSVNSNTSVIKNIKWFFSIVSIIFTGVAIAIIKDFFK